FLPLLLPVPGGRRGAGESPAAAALALDVAARPGARGVGRGSNGPGLRPVEAARSGNAAPRNAGGGVRILDRYVLREFVSYVGLGLAGFIVIFVVVDLFEKIDVFLDHRAPFTLVARFYLFRAPEVIVLAFPVALLLATFLALGQLNKFGELTAMRAAGLPLLRL